MIKKRIHHISETTFFDVPAAAGYDEAAAPTESAHAPMLDLQNELQQYLKVSVPDAPLTEGWERYFRIDDKRSETSRPSGTFPRSKLPTLFKPAGPKCWRDLASVPLMFTGRGCGDCSNSPLILCRASDQLPGHVFRAEAGQHVDLQLNLSLISKDRAPKLEVIKDGQVQQSLAVTDAGQQPPVRLSFDESGWFLVRAVTDNAQTYRFASTAPHYLEIGKIKKRISKKSVQFFLD
jgi:hypothetical protein